jgi:hypothetical protein
MKVGDQLRKLACIADELDGLPDSLADGLRNLALRCDDELDLARQVAAALGDAQRAESPLTGRRGGRRSPGPFNPFDVFGEQGRAALTLRLEHCSVDELKDIIAEHGMDRDRLAMKWKTPQRLIDRVVETVESRATKGDAFRR